MKTIDMANLKLVTNRRHEKLAGVLISPESYARFEKLEDDYWAKVIEGRRTTDGYLSHNASIDALQHLLTK